MGRGMVCSGRGVVCLGRGVVCEGRVCKGVTLTGKPLSVVRSDRKVVWAEETLAVTSAEV